MAVSPASNRDLPTHVTIQQMLMVGRRRAGRRNAIIVQLNEDVNIHVRAGMGQAGVAVARLVSAGVCVPARRGVPKGNPKENARYKSGMLITEAAWQQ